MGTSWPKKRRLIGGRHSRLDGAVKSTGRAKYSYDVNRPGMLHGVILRCPLAHAKIKSIDTSAAAKMPGVKAVIVLNVQTAGTVAAIDPKANSVTVTVRKAGQDAKREIKPGPGVSVLKDGNAIKLADLKPGDKVVLDVDQDCIGREMFFAGDEIAALCADTEEHAQDALRAIKIEFDPLDHVVREEDSLKNPGKKTVPGGGPSNVMAGKEYTKGNVDDAYKTADAVVTGTYGVATICHQCLEPHGLVAEWSEDGGLTVWASTQATVATAGALAAYFGIPPTKVKCLTPYMGGGFGSKFGPDIQGLAAASLAKKANAPVKLMLDREAEITTAGNRPSAYGTVKIAGAKDGSITAFEVDCYGTSGFTGGATVNIGLMPYVYIDAVPNIKRSHTVVRVNAGAARAMRAPGHPQNCILTEFAIDDLAAKLGLEPMRFRLANIPQNDIAAALKAPTSFLALRQTIYTEQLRIAAEKSDWKKKWHPPGKGPASGPVKHGIGMALHTWGGNAVGGPPNNEATVIVSRDGTVTVESSTQDLGTGQRTVSAIIAAEILGLEIENVIVKCGDSSLGFSSGSGGSTTLPSQAPATLRAATAARDDLFAKVGKKLGADPKNLETAPGKIVDTANKKEWSWREFCARLGTDEAKGRGDWSSNMANEPNHANVSNSQVGGCQIAEVLVDSETGVVKVVHIVAVQDCGLLINKMACESQVAGGVIMGVNYALFEERLMDRLTGRQVNADMEFYKLAGIRDIPKITVEMMDMPERGVIGIGEPPTISTAAAIGNAVFNALGVRVPILPLTPQRVLEALAKGGNA